MADRNYEDNNTLNADANATDVNDVLIEGTLTDKGVIHFLTAQDLIDNPAYSEGGLAVDSLVYIPADEYTREIYATWIMCNVEDLQLLEKKVLALADWTLV